MSLRGLPLSKLNILRASNHLIFHEYLLDTVAEYGECLSELMAYNSIAKTLKLVKSLLEKHGLTGCSTESTLEAV